MWWPATRSMVSCAPSESPRRPAEGARWIVFSFISGSLDQDVSELWPATTQPALLVWGTTGGFS